jgi:MYXO-CTERM domain-containing protein
VLVIGGTDGVNGLATCELYDPATGTWSPTGATMTASGANGGRFAVVKLDSGKVVVPRGAPAASELYDPATGTWSPTGSMATARTGFVADLLKSGQVLVAGGANPAGSQSSAELWIPSTGAWTPADPMTEPRGNNAEGILLASGQVLVAGGGAGVRTAEVYTPPMPDGGAAAMVDAGSADAATADAGAPSDTPPTADAPMDAATQTGGGGCDCALARANHATPWPLSALGVAAIALRRARRALRASRTGRG